MLKLKTVHAVVKNMLLANIIIWYTYLLYHAKFIFYLFFISDSSLEKNVLALKVNKAKIPDHFLFRQPIAPLIFVRLSSNFLCMFTTIGAHVQEV